MFFFLIKALFLRGIGHTTFFNMAPKIPKIFMAVNTIPIINILSYADRLLNIFFSIKSREKATTEHIAIKNTIASTEICFLIY